MGLLPGGRVEVVMVTVPAAVTVPVPSVVVPLVMVTVPVTPGGTVAVMATGEPKVLGPEVVTVTVGVVLTTVTVVVGEVAGLLLVSPGVVVEMGLAPTGSDGTVRVAVPLAFPVTTGAVPRTVVPS